MKDIKKTAMRLIPNDHLSVSHSSLGNLPVWDVIMNWYNGEMLHGEELLERVIFLNKRDKIANKRIYQYTSSSRSTFYQYVHRAKVLVDTLKLKDWVIFIEIYGTEKFTVCLIKGPFESLYKLKSRLI